VRHEKLERSLLALDLLAADGIALRQVHLRIDILTDKFFDLIWIEINE